MQVHQNYPLEKFNTFGIRAYAQFFSRFSSLEELRGILDENVYESRLILGGGSNILLTKDFEGFVLKK